jgi:formate/nitrite transporter FocA (FNT family)/nucleotide-binding universal stress UspA family protein
MSDREPDGDTSVRDAVERSRSGAPAVGGVIRDRFETDEVFQRIIAAADEEVTTKGRELFFSALAGGFAITLTFLIYSSMTAKTDGAPVLSALLYPIGFIYIILGGYQLYTENTLPPVALAIERLASLPAMLRQWSIVLAGNVVGGAFGAFVLAYTGVFSPETAVTAVGISQKGLETGFWSLFFKAGFAGLIVAGVVWLDFAARDTVSRFFLVYVAFLMIPLADLFHVVVSATELMYLVFLGEAALRSGLVSFVLPVLLGNTLGGVLLVTVVNYFQTTEKRLESARFEGSERRLSVRESAFGGLVGRSYVPLLDTGSRDGVAEEDAYRVVVPIANPRTETHLVELACTLAEQRREANVHVVHLVETSDELVQRYGPGQIDQITGESKALLRDVEATADAYDVRYSSSTVVSHRSFAEIFDEARSMRADLVVLGWDDRRPWAKDKPQRSFDELKSEPPCEFLVFKDRGLDMSRVLIPTAGGPDSDLSADVATALESSVGAEVSLLHVVDSPADREAGTAFLRSWAERRGLGDAELLVDDSGDVEGAIERAAADKSLVLIGATERGLLSRLVTDSLHLNVINELDCSVAIAERPAGRSLLRRVFGRR